MVYTRRTAAEQGSNQNNQSNQGNQNHQNPNQNNQVPPNNQGGNNNNNNNEGLVGPFTQILAMQNQLMQSMMQTLTQMQQNQGTAPQGQGQYKLGEFLRTRPPTFSQAKDPLEADDWLSQLRRSLT